MLTVLGASNRHGTQKASLIVSLTPDQQNIRDAVLKHCSRFSDDYWLEHERAGRFPHGFYDSLVEAGWVGIAMPTEFGGSGLGISEAAIMMQAIAESGAA